MMIRLFTFLWWADCPPVGDDGERADAEQRLPIDESTERSLVRSINGRYKIAARLVIKFWLRKRSAEWMIHGDTRCQSESGLEANSLSLTSSNRSTIYSQLA